MKTQSLQIYAMLGKPQVTNLHDLNHQILQDLAMTLAPGLGVLPRAPQLSFSWKAQAPAEQSGRPGFPPPCCAGAPQCGAGGGVEGLSQVWEGEASAQVPSEPGRVPLGDAAWLARIGNEC